MDHLKKTLRLAARYFTRIKGLLPAVFISRRAADLILLWAPQARHSQNFDLQEAEGGV